MFDTIPRIDCNGRVLLLDRPRIMGVINLTPDSFSDGGQFATTDSAIEHALKLAEEGADILDIGGESTRPGASAISENEEIARVVPVIEKLFAQVALPISIDTSKPAVMRAAVKAGAGLINDVRALRVEGALEIAAELKVPVCLMHMQGEPHSMQNQPQYEDVVGEVYRFLTERIVACEFAGLNRKQILIDPGFGFGKLLEHNLELLRNLNQFTQIGLPLLVGLSRKSMIGALTEQKNNHDRLHGSLAAAVLAAERGAQILRVHDVRATRDALAILHAVRSKSPTQTHSNARSTRDKTRFAEDD